MVNQSVNEFYNLFLFKIDALPQYVAFSLDINGIFFNNFSPDIRDLLISEGVKVPPRPSNKTKHLGYERILLVINFGSGIRKYYQCNKSDSATINKNPLS